MDVLGRAIELFPYVFHPSTVLGLGLILLIRYEWRQQSAPRAVLWKRIGAFLGVGALAFLPAAAFFVLVRGGFSKALRGSSWRLDMTVAAGVGIAAAGLWVLWRQLDWGPLVPDAAVTLAAVTVPYAALSPIWDVSGHVLLALMPTLYLTLLDRSYWPLLAVPILMVPNRVAVNAHTWAQSVAGFLLAAVITTGLFFVQTRRAGQATRPTSP